MNLLGLIGTIAIWLAIIGTGAALTGHPYRAGACGVGGAVAAVSYFLLYRRIPDHD